jgi:NAD+ diphosphatase
VPSNPRISLHSDDHDRAGHRRTDDKWLEEAWADPSARVLLVAEGKLPVEGDRPVWLMPSEAPEGTRVFLGSTAEGPRFAVVLDRSAESEEWAGLRLLGPVMATDEIGPVVQAVALGEWHRGTRFCPRCGGRLAAVSAGHVLRCESCGTQQFPRSDPAVIMLITSGDRALLGRHSRWAEGRFSTLAGFVESGESLERAVVREVFEETGVRVGEVRYFASQPWPFPSSLMVGFFGTAETTEINVDGEEIVEARWFSREEVLAGTTAGSLRLPAGFSISRALVEEWYGGPLPGSW